MKFTALTHQNYIFAIVQWLFHHFFLTNIQRWKGILCFLFLFLCTFVAQAQDIEDTGGDQNLDSVAMPHYVKVEKSIYKGKTIPHVRLMTPVYIYPPLIFKNDRQKERYNRLVANVKKLLPYAKLARYTILETYQYLQTLPDDASRRAHIKRVEAELIEQYKPVMKKLTRSQGRLLLKLIDRECNQTGLSIARAFLGVARANVYQGLALLFGNSLAKHYDPEGDDRFTERVVRMVESGQL